MRPSSARMAAIPPRLHATIPPGWLAGLLPRPPARILGTGYGEGALSRRLAAAGRVAAMFRARGVREVITIDPHTTTMLRTGYLKLVPGYDVRVRSYLEVLAEPGLPTATPLCGTVVIHDSCV